MDGRSNGRVRSLWRRLPAGRRAEIRDAVRHGVFVAEPRARRRLHARQRRCRSLEDHMSFAWRLLGHYPQQVPLEIGGLLDYAAADRPQRVCELGVHWGGTSYLLSQLLPSVRALVGVDRRLMNEAELRAFTPLGQRRVMIEGPSHAPDTVSRVAEALDGEPVDLLFIDGDHSREGVAGDFLAYRRLVRDGGLIAFHDILPDPRTGVPEVWRELAARHEHREFVEDPARVGMGIGVLRHRADVELTPGLLLG